MENATSLIHRDGYYVNRPDAPCERYEMHVAWKICTAAFAGRHYCRLSSVVVGETRVECGEFCPKCETSEEYALNDRQTSKNTPSDADHTLVVSRSGRLG